MPSSPHSVFDLLLGLTDAVKGLQCYTFQQKIYFLQVQQHFYHQDQIPDSVLIGIW